MHPRRQHHGACSSIIVVLDKHSIHQYCQYDFTSFPHDDSREPQTPRFTPWAAQLSHIYSLLHSLSLALFVRHRCQHKRHAKFEGDGLAINASEHERAILDGARGSLGYCLICQVTGRFMFRGRDDPRENRGPQRCDDSSVQSWFAHLRIGKGRCGEVQVRLEGAMVVKMSRRRPVRWSGAGHDVAGTN